MRKFLHTDLRGIALSGALASLSLQLINVFFALMLLNRGLQLWQICGFYFVYAVFGLASVYPCARLMNRHGVRLSFLAGYIARAIYGILLTAYITGLANWVLIPLAASFGIAAGLLLCAQAFHVSRVMDEQRKGRDLARIETTTQLIGWTAPLGGGLIAAARGQIWLGTIAVVLAILAALPVWRSDRLGSGYRPVPSVKWRHHASWPDLLAAFGWSWQTGVGFWAWSIYLATTVPDFRTIGTIASATMLVMFVLMNVAGHWIDRRGVRSVLLAAVLVSVLIHLFRVGIVEASAPNFTPVVILLLLATANLAYGVCTMTLQIPWRSQYYSRAREGGIGYVASMEAATFLAQIGLWGGLAALAWLCQDLALFFKVAFISGAVAVCFCLCIGRKSHKGQFGGESFPNPGGLNEALAILEEVGGQKTATPASVLAPKNSD